MPEKKDLAVIIMGSGSDEGYAREIVKTFDNFHVPYELRVASAHKSPTHLISIIDGYNIQNNRIVFIAVAGRSNALGGFIDGRTPFPVISAPPYSEKYGGMDVLSSLRMPSGIGAVTAIEAETAALAAVKIFALGNDELARRVLEYQGMAAVRIIQADLKVKGVNNG